MSDHSIVDQYPDPHNSVIGFIILESQINNIYAEYILLSNCTCQMEVIDE